MWTDYFKMNKIQRGRIVTSSHGELDFSRDDIPVEICKELFEQDFPFLDLTPLGRQFLYGEIENEMPLLHGEIRNEISRTLHFSKKSLRKRKL